MGTTTRIGGTRYANNANSPRPRTNENRNRLTEYAASMPKTTVAAVVTPETMRLLLKYVPKSEIVNRFVKFASVGACGRNVGGYRTISVSGLNAVARIHTSGRSLAASRPRSAVYCASRSGRQARRLRAGT